MENGLNKRHRLTDMFCMLPICIFILSIILVRLHLFSMPMTDVYWSEATNSSTLADLFNYWKSIAIIGSACLAVIVFIAGYFGEWICFKKSFLYIPALAYVVFVLISLAFSDYKYFALRGMSEHFEGSIVLIAYILMISFIANTIDSERRLKCLIYCVFTTAFLLGLLGFTQAIGYDFLSTVTGQKLITPNYLLENGVTSWNMIDILAASGQKLYAFVFEKGEVYQTVYNINYVPLYLSLLIPVCAVLFIYFGTSTNKFKNARSIIFLVLFAVLLYNFFAASSASGYLGLATAFIAALLIFRGNLKKWVKFIFCLFLIVGLILGLLSDMWMSQLKEIWGYVKNLSFDYIYADDSLPATYSFEHNAGAEWATIDFIETKEDYLLFSIGNNVLVVSRDEENGIYIFADDSGKQLYLRELANEKGYFEILDEGFHDYVKVSLVKSDEHTFLRLTTRANEWLFYYDGNSFLHYNKVGKYVSLEKIDHSTFIKDYRFGTNRGLVWDTTIPMLKRFIFKGSGADTFTFVYPQRDYATLYNTFWGEKMALVTDKAHNLYMQYWVNTGLLSLLAWLMLVGYYLVSAVKSFRKRGFVEFSDFVNGGIFCGIIGFLFVAFFNDGSVNTMPMFYTMLGTGLAINMKDKWSGALPGSENGAHNQVAMPKL